MEKCKESELVLAEDGSLYHIRLKPEHLADHVLLFGDPGRVQLCSALFDQVEFQVSNREMHSITGTYHGKRVSMLSTGMGTDNIDIVMNELDAVCNIDLPNRTPKQDHRSLSLIRVGTCGALQREIQPGSILLSEFAIGLDGLLSFYEYPKEFMQEEISKSFMRQMSWPSHFPYPYAVKGSEELLSRFSALGTKGITVTAPGFYGPQGRALRLKPSMANLSELLGNCVFDEGKIVNLEMETSALYGLSKVLGHQALTICLVVANRREGSFLSSYKNQMQDLVRAVLEELASM